MFTYRLRDWTLDFPKNYEVVEGDSTSVILDEQRDILTILTLKDSSIYIERTYYPMMYEIDAENRKIIFWET